MNQVKTIQVGLLEVMDEFHLFCETNDLKYFLVGGTQLGAIRHSGFIPWDDDLDVVMIRDDYKKLLSLGENFKAPFVLKDISLDKNYIYPFAKLTNNNIILKEEFYKSFDTGVWIDIFPLDYTFESTKVQNLHYKIIKILRNIFILKCGSFKVKKRSIISLFVAKILHKFLQFLPVSLFTKLFYLLGILLPKKLSNKKNYVNLYGAWGAKEITPVKLFKKRKLYDFEGRKFWGIEDADFWLKKVYGDYMQLPEVSKRISEHVGKIIYCDEGLKR